MSEVPNKDYTITQLNHVSEMLETIIIQLKLCHIYSLMDFLTLYE